ncbi:arginine repressor [Vagococcus vulneris]|uniref:Arginine repressor n=1 Tax=Vagococcus vulneris TaxID=1977869 RepID=A0A429ZYB7_9ENTE|nr:ArgR family transcriptional regulator [Vagococcus vulneris]RST98944.1 hypothetical protein CBF37_06130 [Vagococcus vulneris]
MNKKMRQQILKKIISEHDVENQSDLLELLKENGVDATQPTISRDIKELNIIKSHNSNGSSTYRVLTDAVISNKKLNVEEKLISALSEAGVSLNRVEFLNILTVLPGNGQAIAILIDTLKQTFSEIIASLAGDDTIIIISADKEKAENVYNYFHQFF